MTEIELLELVANLLKPHVNVKLFKPSCILRAGDNFGCPLITMVEGLIAVNYFDQVHYRTTSLNPADPDFENQLLAIAR